ncbi:MAG: hypothetical protein FD176_3511, partial [Rhodospirillaceae bacterium]
MTLQTDLAAAVAQVTADSTLLHKVVHGPAGGTESQVVTEGGPVKTVAKAIADIDTQLQSSLETLDQKVAAAAASAALAVHSADAAETSKAAIAANAQAAGLSETNAAASASSAMDSAVVANASAVAAQESRQAAEGSAALAEQSRIATTAAEAVA